MSSFASLNILAPLDLQSNKNDRSSCAPCDTHPLPSYIQDFSPLRCRKSDQETTNHLRHWKKRLLPKMQNAVAFLPLLFSAHAAFCCRGTGCVQRDIWPRVDDCLICITDGTLTVLNHVLLARNAGKERFHDFALLLAAHLAEVVADVGKTANLVLEGEGGRVETTD
jgi:hypothetical protein